MWEEVSSPPPIPLTHSPQEEVSFFVKYKSLLLLSLDFARFEENWRLCAVRNGFHGVDF